MSCELAQNDAAYVLGALTPDERLVFERHLATCPTCSAAVRDVAGLPGLLAQVSPEVVESPQEPEPLPSSLLPNLVREVRRSQHRRRWVGGLVAAAAVLVLGAGTVLAVTNGDDGAPPQAVSTLATAHQMEQVDQTGVWGKVALTSVLWGTRLDLTCSYEEPASAYPDGGHTYALVVHTRDGGTEQVATWNGLPGRTMHVTGATALTTDQIRTVEVQDAAGDTLLELTS
ncbi:anti-sigma factor family protein [Nocardioides sp. HB32]